MEGLKREQKDLEFIDRGGALGMISMVAFGIFDPFMLVPCAGAVAKLRTVKRLAKLSPTLGGGVVALQAGFIGSTASELALQASQDTRTLGESALNIALGTVLSGLLGAAAAGLSSTVRNALMKEIGRDFDITGTGGKVVGGSGEEGLPRVLIADVMDDAVAGTNKTEIKVRGAFGVERVFAALRVSPMLRVMVRSRAQEAKRVMMELSDQGFIVDGFEGGRSVQAVVDAYDFHRAMYMLEGDRLYGKYMSRVTGKQQGGTRIKNNLAAIRRTLARTDDDLLSPQEFRERAGMAARLGDSTDSIKVKIPAEAAELAKVHRKLIYDPLADEYIKLGLIDPEVLEKGPAFARSYMKRMYNIQKINEMVDSQGRSAFKQRIKVWVG